MPKISIIIPACNEENYIKKTLNSVKSQTFKDYELIVVCNGCADSTERIAKTFTNKVINIKKKSVSLARNIGAENSSGELLIFLDADTYFPKVNTLEKINNINPEIATCLGSPNRNKLIFKLFFLFKNLIILTKIKKHTNGIMICKKNIFNKTQGFNKNLIVTENRDFLKRAEKYGKFKIINEKVSTSMRRFEALGFLKLTIFWIDQIIKKKNIYKIIR